MQCGKARGGKRACRPRIWYFCCSLLYFTSQKDMYVSANLPMEVPETPPTAVSISLGQFDYFLYAGGDWISASATHADITAVFRSIGHAIFAPRERRSSITTYLRFNRNKNKTYLLFWSLLSLFLISFLISLLFYRTDKPRQTCHGDSWNPAGLLINRRGLLIWKWL